MINFYLKESFRIFRKSAFATIITISITTIAVILTSLSVFIVFGANQLSDTIKRSIEVNIYLADTLSTKNIQTIQERLTNEAEVLSLKFINKEDAVAEFLKETGEDFRKVLNENPLPNSFVLKFRPQPLKDNNIEMFVDKYKRIEGVTEVVYDYKTVIRVLNILNSSQTVLYALSLALILLAVYLVYSNNKIQIYNSKSLYFTMNLVGAETNTMRFPVILNGLLIGLISSLICVILFNSVIVLLTQIYNNIKFTHQIQLFSLVILLIGIVLGFAGSFISSLKISSLLNEQ